MTLEKQALSNNNGIQSERCQQFDGAAVGEVQDCKLEEVETPKESDGVNPFDVHDVVQGDVNDKNDDADDDNDDDSIEILDPEEFEYKNTKNDDEADETLNKIPSIEEQRSIISALLDKQSELTEGSELRVISDTWFQMFQQNEFKDTQEALQHLGPINTLNLIDSNGIFADPIRYPYIAVSVEIFDTLVSWYSLYGNSQPVVTYAIEVDGQLAPEFSKPFFQLHHLVVDGQANPNPNSYYSSVNYAPIPTFTLSSLNTCHDVIKKSIENLNNKEHSSKFLLDSNDKKYKVWVVSDDKISQLNYQISPSNFSSLSQKVLIKKEHHNTLLKATQLRVTHLVIEQKIISHTPGKKRSESYWPSNFDIQHPPTPSDGRIGLQNLGNSCYMNSALQCLVHIPELTEYFLFNCFEKELNEDNPLGFGGHIASTFGRLIHFLFDKKSNRATYISPREFKNTIGHYNSMFHGYQQQDSQEFFAYLLDGLHEDLNRILKKPITEKPELNSKNATQEEVKALAEESWVQHKLRNDSVITDLFVGLYKSTLVCPACSKVSITFDPFSDLTLPLPTETFWNFKVLLFLDKGPMKTFEVELPKASSYNTLKQYIANKLELNANHLVAMDIYNGQFYTNYEDPASQSGFLPISDLIDQNDCVIVYEIPHEEDDLVIPVVNTKTTPSSVIPSSFAYPFFITLKQEEIKSFGVIRRKLEEKYEQLSTYKYFTKVRENQNNKTFRSSDFPLLSQNGSAESNPNDENEGYESDVSLANPEISGDYAFKVKVHDSSRLKSRVRRTYNPLGSSSTESSTSSGVIYAPFLNNNFTNLPDLLESVPEPKRSYYTYGHKLDIDNSTSSDVSVETPSATSTSDDTKVDSIPSKVNSGDNVGAASSAGDLIQTSSNDDSETTPEVDMTLDVVKNDEDDEPELSPLFKDSSNSSSEDNRSKETVLQSTKPSAVSDKPLIEPRSTLVCEWTSDSYDTFFSGLDDEGEGGTNLWDSPEVIVNEEVEAAKKRRADKKNDTLSLDSCLKTFSKPEVLGEHDLWYCSDCKEHRQASKQISIWSTPDILSIHLKRFETQRNLSDKITKVVDFPIENLDIAPYISKPIGPNEETIYDLYAVDNHYGSLSGGHYTSYVKNFVDNKWYYYDDSRVTETDPTKAISGAAYLLFYRKRSTKHLGGTHLSEAIEKAREEHEERERVELRAQQEFYEENRDGSSDEEEDEEDLEDVSSSEDNVSSVHVGSDDEDDESATRRKQRVLGRGKRSLLNDNYVQSDVDTSALGSPNSVVSDDNMSEYSTTLNPPSSIKNSNVNSPRPGQ